MAKLTINELKVKIKELKLSQAPEYLPVDEYHTEWWEVSFKGDLENASGQVKYKDVTGHFNSEEEALSAVEDLATNLFDDQFLEWL